MAKKTEKNRVIIEALLSEQEIESLFIAKQPEELTDYELEEKLIKENTILVVDWSGEFDKYEIVSFLQSRLDVIAKEKLALEREDVYKKIDKKINKGEFERGDQPPFILNYYHIILKKAGYPITLIDHQNDAYYITITSVDKSKKLKKLKDEYWDFTTYGQRSGEALYTIYCLKCKSMNVWQLDSCLPVPDEGNCDSCNTPLFDEKGAPVTEMIKEMI